MLILEHNGSLIYSKKDYQGDALRPDDLQKGVDVMELLCVFHNLGIDGTQFIEAFFTLLDYPNEEWIIAVKEFDQDFDYYFNYIKESGMPFIETIESKINHTLLFAAKKIFGYFSGAVIAEYLVKRIKAKSLAENVSVDDGDYLVFLQDTIVAVFDEIVLMVDTIFQNKPSNKYTQEIYENQNIKYRIIPFGKAYVPLYEIEFSDILSLALFTSFEYFKTGKMLCVCKNCKRTFSPTLRKEEVYCTHINKNGKTCKEVGYENTLDSIEKAYRIAYKTKNAYKNRILKLKNKSNIQKVYDSWVERAQQLKEGLKNGTATEEEYYNHLNGKLK